MRHYAIFVIAVAITAPIGAQEKASPPPSSPEQLMVWLEEHWSASGWGANGSQKYMRPLDDSGWKVRMRALQEVVKMGE